MYVIDMGFDQCHRYFYRGLPFFGYMDDSFPGWTTIDGCRSFLWDDSGDHSWSVWSLTRSDLGLQMITIFDGELVWNTKNDHFFPISEVLLWIEDLQHTPPTIETPNVDGIGNRTFATWIRFRWTRWNWKSLLGVPERGGFSTEKTWDFSSPNLDGSLILLFFAINGI